MALLKERSAEPIPGYRLVERLGSGGFGEVWKCEAPGGLFKAIKFVYGNLDGLNLGGDQAEEELRAIERIKVIRHPFLLSMDRVEVVGGELLIVTELADRSLSQLLEELRQTGLPGIPFAQLLGYLREAAEVLDLLNIQHSLQHLDVKPHNLFLVSNHLKVADFGLVSSLGASGRIQLGAITPLYASPEVFQGRISPRSDQYSLAVVYQELVSGTLPFQGKNSRQLLLQHTKGEPNLEPLPEADRPVVARALAKDPEARFPTCLDFIRALRTARAATAALAPPESRIDSVLEPRAAAPRPAGPQHNVDTDQALRVTPPRAAPARNAAPSVRALAGWRFGECLGATPLMEVWKVQDAQGRERQVQLIYGAATDVGRLEEAVARFGVLHHPALPAQEIVQCDPGRLVLVTDPARENLRDRCQQCQARRAPGIGRQELLGYLRAAAETLDYLYQQHSIPHLGLSPRTLLLDQGRLLLGEFGLAVLFWLPAGQPVAQRNGRYCAPEVFEGKIGPAADQFSLAVLWQELLTGQHPFPGPGARSTAGEARPNLEALPEGDRAAIARALDRDPGRRWPSCTDLVKALAGQPPGEEPAVDRFSQRLREAAAAPTPHVQAPADADGSPLGEIITNLVLSAGGTAPAPEEVPTLVPGQGLLRHQFSAGLPLGTARTKVEAFRRLCHGQLIRDEEGQYVFHVSMPARFWRQWVGRQPGLEVQVGLARQHTLAATPIDVTVQVRAFRCGQARAAQLLEEMGTSLLEGLRAALLVNSEKRLQERLLWPHPLQVRPVRANGTPGEPVTCRGKDISLSGIGFYLPHELATAEVAIDLPATPQSPALSVPATLVRAKRCADGWYEVGALFRLTALRKSNSRHSSLVTSHS